MAVTIKIPLYWHHWTNNIETFDVKGSTVGECLDQFVGRYPTFRTVFFASEGVLNGPISVYVNGLTARPEGLAKPVKDGDILTLAVSGSCCE